MAIGVVSGVCSAQSPKDGAGWTSFAPSLDTRVVYVSTSGKDTNSGLSPKSPKSSLAAAYELMRPGFPDWMLLKRGDVWEESFPEWTKGGRSASEMMLVGSYGSGDRPTLRTGSRAGFYAAAFPDPVAHLALTDISFIADRVGGNSRELGVNFLNKWDDVLIENCRVEGYRSNIVMEGLKQFQTNVRVRRCVVVNAYSQTSFSGGIYTGMVDGLTIEECVFDHNGWRRGLPGAHATVFNHNMYLHGSCRRVVTRGNISARASATGISQRCGGISEDNLLLQCPTGLFMGGDHRVTFPPGGRGAARNNVVLDSRDIDSYDPRGVGIAAAGVVNLEIYGNIVSGQRTGSGNIIAYDLGSLLQSVILAHNIAYDWTIPGQPEYGIGALLDFHQATGMLVTDNTIAQPGGGFVMGHIPSHEAEFGQSFGRNRYITVNPEPNQFYYATTYESWVLATNEPWSAFVEPGFPAPARDAGSYMQSIGMTPTLEAFLSMATLQEKGAWDSRFTAAAVNAYIRQGFGTVRRGCRADFDGNNVVSVLDLTAFQSAWSSSQASADIDLDGLFTSEDVRLYQSIFLSGCP